MFKMLSVCTTALESVTKYTLMTIKSKDVLNAYCTASVDLERGW